MADRILAAYEIARERYAELGVDVDGALEKLSKISISLQCWQGDDVGGFENARIELGSGLAVTGKHPGKARNIDELKADLAKAFSLIPGDHRLNLHAMYGDFFARAVDRDAIEEKHFQTWVDFAKDLNLGLDFNATCFSHPNSDDGFTLSHRDKNIRDFWIDHVNACRRIGQWVGEQTGTPCVHNLWIPDGSKDETANRALHRNLLAQSLEVIYSSPRDPRFLKDAVESKLFGIGSESYVVGSHDFYLAWATSHDTMICLDMGHYHPTESVADKISALLPFFDELLIHVSRGVRWDSDHVVIFSDPLVALMQEIVRSDALDRVHLALDFFDASINRVGAWVIGARATLKAILFALLEPTEILRQKESEDDLFSRLALLEHAKTLPFGAVWEKFCAEKEVPTGLKLTETVLNYEKKIVAERSQS